MFLLSLSAFDILWQDLADSSGHQRVPYPLQVPSAGATMEERARIRASVYQELSKRGLYTGGVLDPSLKKCWEILANARTYVECEALTDVNDVDANLARAVIALSQSGSGGTDSNGTGSDGTGSDGTDRAEAAIAALVQQDDQEINLRILSASDAFSALANALPAVTAGASALTRGRRGTGQVGYDGRAGQPIRLPVSALADHGEDPVFHSRGTERGFYHREIGQIRTIQSRPVVAAGQFAVRRRDGEGRLSRGESGSWFLNDTGGYFGVIEPGTGGDWLSLEVVDASRLAGRLAELAR